MSRASKERRQRGKAKRPAAGRRSPSVLLRELWNLPNILTMVRIAIIPLFVWLTYEGDPLNSVLAGAVFAVAAITDVIDGWLARRWNLVTVVGKFLDPLADKLIVTAALVMLVRLGRVPAWLVITILARELIVTGLRSVAASEGMVIAAGQEGKWKTSFQLVAIICLCVHYVHPLDLLWATYPVSFNAVGLVLLYLSAVMAVWSAAVYFKSFLTMLSKRDSGSEEVA